MTHTRKNRNNSTQLELPFDAWKLIENNRFELVSFELKPGESIPLHKNDKEVLFYISRGEGKLIVETEELLLKKDDAIVVESGLEREWSNHTQNNLGVLVFKLL